MFLLLKICRAPVIRENRFVAEALRFSTSVQSSLKEVREVKEVKEIHPNKLLVQKHLKLSSKRIEDVFQKYAKLEKLSRVSLLNSLSFLRSLSLQYVDIRQHPDLLLYSANQLENYYMRLRECGYRQMTAYRLKNHNIIMSHSVLFNKCYNYLPCELNIFENIALIAGIKLTADKSFVYEERMPMKDVHLAATKIFLKQRLNLTDHVVTKLIRQFPSLKERSINNIRQTIDLLENKFGFPLDRIAQSYLLIANTSTLRKLDEMQEVYGVDVRSIVSNAPQIVRADISNIIGIKNLLHLYKVPSYAAAYWKRIFTMHPKTLTANMIELDQFDLPFNPFEHPAILKLAQHLNSIQNQLDSHNNSGKTDRITLEKFIEFYLSRCTTLTLMAILTAHLLERSEEEMRSLLANISQYKNAPCYEVMSSFRFLLSKKFQLDDIFQNFVVIFYPRAKIKGSLIQINESATYSDLETGELTQSQVLRLCVYLMEKDSKFSGNGFDMHYFTAKFADDEILAMIDIIQIVFGTAPIEQKPPIF